MKYLILYILASLFSLAGYSQDYPIKFLDISNGLSNNSVTTIYQDTDGFMWFGTYDGLNRYDGYTFKVFRNRINDNTSLISNTVYSIEGDSHKNIWVGGSNGGSVYDNTTAAFHTLQYTPAPGAKPALVKGIIHQIRAVSTDMVLVASQNLGLLVYENGSFTGRRIPLQGTGNKKDTYDYDAAVLENNGTGCWVYIKNAGMCRYDYTSKKLKVVHPMAADLQCMKMDTGSNLWLGTDEGLFLFNTQSFTLSANYFSGKCTVTNILRDKNKQLWAATDGCGLYTVNLDTKKAVEFNPPNAGAYIKSNSIWGLYEDATGNKWIGTLRGGISMIGNSPKYFKSIKYKEEDNDPAENFILSFCEDEKNNVWIGTDGAGLRYWDRKANTYKLYNKTPGAANYITSNFITSIVRDKNNEIWLSTWAGGVNRINPVTNAITHYSCYNPYTKRTEKNIWLVYEDSQKNLWASATNDGSLYLFDRTANTFTLFDSTINNLQCLTETADGKLWGGNYTSLIAIDKAGKKHTRVNIGYPVRCIHEDSSKNLWVGTQEGGLLLFDRKTNTYKRLTTDDGLPSNTILRLLEDKKGNLWMSTYNGICRYDSKDKTFRSFSINDGLQSNQFSFNAGVELSTGEFLFGGINGFNIFYPEAIKNSGSNTRILLTGLHINNQPIESKADLISAWNAGQVKEIRLPYDQTTMSLEFVALDYNNADKINYAYYLEGWDDHWNYVDKTRKANYARLPEGSYVFKVRTTNLQGRWNEAESLVYVVVLPPWYRTWWAYTAYFLMFVGAIAAYIQYSKHKEKLKYKVKIAQLESKKEKEIAEKQLSMFTYISHEFRTPLSLIINPLKKMVQKESVQSGSSGSDLAIAHRNARRLLSLVDQLLLLRKAESDADLLRVSSINVNSLCNEVYQCFVSQAKDKKITYTFNVPDKDIEIIGDYEKIEISLFNLMSNAFKYTPAGGSISLTLAETDKEISIAIKDTGAGIPQGELQSIFEKFRQVNSHVSVGTGFGIGLYIVKYFVEKHQGSVTCASEPGKGSLFTLNFLKGYDHFEDVHISAATPKMSELVEELLADNIDDTAEPQTNPEEELNKKILTDKRSVLVIDDNAEIRNYLVKLFSESYVVYSAENGEEGLTLTKKHMPDLVVSDITMEVMDGLELCRKIKGNEELSHIPVILLTASQNTETHLQGINDGADDYIMKPFDDDILVARVDSLLRSRSNLRKYFLDSITLKENTQKVPAEYQEFLKKCIDTIEANIDNPEFSIKAFAAEMGMSHRTLYTKIKIISGQTLNAFMRSVKLRRAAMLMLTESINIAQASAQVGFEDQKYFRQQFVKLFGMTPSEYIKKYKSSFNTDLNIIK